MLAIIVAFVAYVAQSVKLVDLTIDVRDSSFVGRLLRALLEWASSGGGVATDEPIKKLGGSEGA
jgi:hypothetical protein